MKKVLLAFEAMFLALALFYGLKWLRAGDFEPHSAIFLVLLGIVDMLRRSQILERSSGAAPPTSRLTPAVGGPAALPATDKWVGASYAQASGLDRKYAAEDHELRWSRADEEVEWIELRGWGYVLVDEPDGRSTRLRFGTPRPAATWSS